MKKTITLLPLAFLLCTPSSEAGRGDRGKLKDTTNSVPRQSHTPFKRTTRGSARRETAATTSAASECRAADISSALKAAGHDQSLKADILQGWVQTLIRRATTIKGVSRYSELNEEKQEFIRRSVREARKAIHEISKMPGQEHIIPILSSQIDTLSPDMDEIREAHEASRT